MCTSLGYEREVGAIFLLPEIGAKAAKAFRT